MKNNPQSAIVSLACVRPTEEGSEPYRVQYIALRQEADAITCVPGSARQFQADTRDTDEAIGLLKAAIAFQEALRHDVFVQYARQWGRDAPIQIYLRYGPERSSSCPFLICAPIEAVQELVKARVEVPDGLELAATFAYLGLFFALKYPRELVALPPAPVNLPDFPDYEPKIGRQVIVKLAGAPRT